MTFPKCLRKAVTPFYRTERKECAPTPQQNVMDLTKRLDQHAMQAWLTQKWSPHVCISKKATTVIPAGQSDITASGEGPQNRACIHAQAQRPAPQPPATSGSPSSAMCTCAWYSTPLCLLCQEKGIPGGSFLSRHVSPAQGATNLTDSTDSNIHTAAPWRHAA